MEVTYGLNRDFHSKPQVVQLLFNQLGEDGGGLEEVADSF